ncbi:hypothetical protein B296_00041193 [Ensete ventricosum]|uniref:Ribosome biogenesis protein NOP53 n=1 Tax=Ensete ventricosum TaxID=4639 RepID=A0A426ZMP9_ENSVE|nr:hypothetical protein B296_00041193 [Ensete ventricosum]
MLLWLQEEDTTSFLTDIWGGEGCFCEAAGKTRKVKMSCAWLFFLSYRLNFLLLQKQMATLIPAVEVEPPGCSFNPPFEAHQDSLAQAVADEMQNIYKKELGPQPVPVTVPGEPVTEEDKYFLEADDGNESDKEGETGNDDSELPELRYPFVNRFFSFFKLLVRFCSLLCYRFEPAPVQVLLTEEISGSLRKLKLTVAYLLVNRRKQKRGE